MNLRNFPADNSSLILEYLDNDTRIKPTLFFDQSNAKYGLVENSIARESGRYALAGDLNKLIYFVSEAAVTEGFVDIMRIEILAADRHGRTAKGTLLQLAAMAGDFNHNDVADQGMVEVLAKLAQELDILSANEITEQISAVFPDGWDEEKSDMHQRMNLYHVSLIRFMDDLINAKDDKSYGVAVATFKENIKSAARTDGVITSGYIFNPAILKKAINLFVENVDNLGGWLSHKSTLFCKKGIGGLQDILNARDLQSINAGLCQVMYKNNPVGREIHFSADIPERCKNLGDEFFFAFSDGCRSRERQAIVNAWDNISQKRISAFLENKKTSLVSICATSTIAPRKGCA